MKQNVNTVERAFELARTGKFRSIEKIRACLRREGYSAELVVGKYLSAQLNDLMRQADPETHGIGSHPRQRRSSSLERDARQR